MFPNRVTCYSNLSPVYRPNIIPTPQQPVTAQWLHRTFNVNYPHRQGCHDLVPGEFDEDEQKFLNWFTLGRRLGNSNAFVFWKILNEHQYSYHENLISLISKMLR